MTIAEKYRLLEQLGGKGKRKFAQVYFGENKATAEKVILKICTKTEDNQHLVDRLRQEGTYTFVLEGLPEILDVFESDSELIVVKRFVTGITLMDYLNNFSPKEKQKRLIDLLNQLAVLLNHIHASGIYHLDLKPGNILVDDTKKNKISLIDFGMAHSKQDLGERKTLFPLGYAAPELLLNKLELVDQRTDYFALAVTCWQCLMGQLPLIDQNPSITTNLQLTHPLPSLRKVYHPFETPLQKLGAKYHFQVPPNRMDSEKLIVALKQGMDKRYANLEAFLTDIETELKKQPKLNWWPFR